MVDKNEERHEKLTVKSVGKASVTRDNCTKVFDVEGAFETGSEKSAERSDQGSEDGEYEGVKLERVSAGQMETRLNDKKMNRVFLFVWMCFCLALTDALRIFVFLSVCLIACLFFCLSVST